MYLFCIAARRTAAHLPHGLAFRPHMAYDKGTAKAQRPLRVPLGNEVTEMKKIMLLLSKVTCIMAMALAVLSVNSTCGFTAYQPDVPESLEHD